MKDTSDFMLSKQREMFMSRPQEERLTMGCDMIDEVREITFETIKRKYPKLSLVEQKIELFKLYYAKDLPSDFIEGFSENLKIYHKNKANG